MDRVVAARTWSMTIVATCRSNRTQFLGTPMTRLCICSGKSSIGVVGTSVQRLSRFLRTCWSVRCMSSTVRSLPRHRDFGNPTGAGVPTFAYENKLYYDTILTHKKHYKIQKLCKYKNFLNLPILPSVHREEEQALGHCRNPPH